MQEDHAQLRMGHAPEMLAILNNIVLGLFARQGERNMAHARRNFAYHLDKALASLVASWRTDFATALANHRISLDKQGQTTYNTSKSEWIGKDYWRAAAFCIMYITR